MSFGFGRKRKKNNTTICRQKLDEMSFIFRGVGGSCNVRGELSLREKCGGTSLQREDYTKTDFVIRSEENTAA